MNKIYLSFLLLLVGTLSNLSAQITFEKSYGGAGDDRAQSAIQTFNGGYFIAGSTQSYGAGFYDAYFIKTNANGDTLWTKTYGGTDNEFIFSAVQTKDSGYAICGSNPSVMDS